MNQDRRNPSALSPEVHQVARGSVLNIVSMILGAVLGFLLTVVVSRWLQPTNAGALFELIAIFSILSYTLMLGADTGLTRWISRARAIGGIKQVRLILVIAIGPILIVGTVAAGIMWIEAPAIAHTLLRGMGTPEAVRDIRIIAPLIPLGAISASILAALRAYGLMWPYLAIEGLGKPIARMGLVLVALYLGLRLTGVVVAWSLPVAGGLIAACLILARVITAESALARHSRQPAQVPARRDRRFWSPGTRGRRNPKPGRHRGASPEEFSSAPRLAGEFWRFAGPRGFAGTFQIVVVWLDILLVGAVLSRYAAGVYGAVSKLAMVGNFALEGTRMTIGPQLSALLARGENRRTQELYQSATRWLIMAVWPMYVLFAIFPTVVLGIFGHRYTVGAASLVVLSVAMLVSLGTGNVSVVLLMGGKSSWNAMNTLFALAINIVLNLTLMPHIGILGAAIAWAASIVADNVAAVIEVWLLLHMRPFGPGYALVAASTVACFALAGFGARELMGQNLAALAVATATGLAAFVIVAYWQRARLQLSELAAALMPGRPAPTAAASHREAAQPSATHS